VGNLLARPQRLILNTLLLQVAVVVGLALVQVVVRVEF
jgi:hypothetical protein